MGMGFLSIMTLLPIIVIFLLIAWRNTPVHIASLIGWALCVMIALAFFSTSLAVSIRASLAGVVQSFPVTIVCAATLLQICFMEETGALRRICTFLKTVAITNKASQIMIINLGAGTTLVSAGATPVAVLPPVLKGLGYSNFMAIALPALGFDALCTYSMLGAPLVAFSDITGVSLIEASQIFALYLPIISTLIAFAMLYLVGGTELMGAGFFPALSGGLIAGLTAVAIAYVPALHPGIVLTGVIAGVLVILVECLYLKVKGYKILDRSVLNDEDLQVEKERSLLAAFSPWLLTISLLFFVNFYQPVHDFLTLRLGMPVQIIPGQKIYLRVFWNAYFWVLVGTIVSAIWLKPTGTQIKGSLSKFGKRAPKPLISLTVFFALGLLMNNTGLQPVGEVWQVTDAMHNMVSVLALESARIFGWVYPLIVAPLGLFGGFVTSSEAAALGMFAKYNFIAAEELFLNPLVVAAATGIGAGLASVISPGKLQNAAAVIDAVGEEQAVIRKVFPICLGMIIVASLLCFVFSKFI